MLFFILLLMLVLGPVQVIWAFIHVAFTKDDNTRRRFGYYFIGVGIYFAVLIPMWYSFNIWHSDPLVAIHFYGGAWSLAIYHIYIVAKSIPRPEPDLMQVDMDGHPI